MYILGRNLASWLIKKGEPLQVPFFSGIYQEFYNHVSKRHRYKSPDYERLDALHRDKHDRLIKVSSELSELKEKHIELSKKYSSLVRKK